MWLWRQVLPYRHLACGPQIEHGFWMLVPYVSVLVLGSGSGFIECLLLLRQGPTHRQAADIEASCDGCSVVCSSDQKLSRYRASQQA